MSGKINIRKRFLQLAYKQLNPDFHGDFLVALEQSLVNWYCFQYNVPPNDDKLRDMTLEELLVLNQMHKLRENPQLADEINSDASSYEDWLKAQMGADYVSEEEMVKKAEQEEQAEQKELQALADSLPPVITTDFSKAGAEE